MCLPIHGDGSWGLEKWFRLIIFYEKELDNLGDKLDDVVKAINSISISTDHQIIDTSRVQIVLSNRRDLEIDGVNIYYDLNRVYPNLSSEGSVKQSQIESASS